MNNSLTLLETTKVKVMADYDAIWENKIFNIYSTILPSGIAFTIGMPQGAEVKANDIFRIKDVIDDLQQAKDSLYNNNIAMYIEKNRAIYIWQFHSGEPFVVSLPRVETANGLSGEDQAYIYDVMQNFFEQKYLAQKMMM